MCKWIESTWVYKNNETGIYYIIINTVNKWIDFHINKYSPTSNYIYITKFETAYDEYMPGKFDEYEEEKSELVFIEDGFDSFNYLITHTQEKDQIYIVCIPNDLILSNFFKKV